jgi:CheY-like chemotaxis protein
MVPIHILLVEDNEGDIILTTEALTEGKVINSISVVKNGEDAISFLEKKEKYPDAVTPDLILLDINLPKMNGHQVLKIIKKNKKLKHIPVIIFTTSSSEKDIAESYSNDANYFISKPVDIDEFLKVAASIQNFWISLVQLPQKN